MSVKLEFVRKMTPQQFEAWKTLEGSDKLFVAHFLAEMFVEFHKDKEFVIHFRDMLGYEPSVELQLAIEGDARYT